MSTRITVTLSKEAAEIVARYMEANGVSKSRAINDLILIGAASWRSKLGSDEFRKRLSLMQKKVRHKPDNNDQERQPDKLEPID
jgi:hypothetical protein